MCIRDSTEGVELAVEEVCIPLKVFYGHCRSLIGKCDFVFIPRYISLIKNTYTCPRFLVLPDVTRFTVKNLPILTISIKGKERPGMLQFLLLGIKMRKKAQSGGAIPITLRQFEALIRLAEASAKIQLQDKVRKEDAQRAIRLMKYSLHQLGFDPETGEIDIDRTEGGVSSSERSRIRIILDIINELSQKRKEILIEDIRKRAKEEGIEDVDEVIEKLKAQGLLFEPSPGYVQKV